MRKWLVLLVMLLMVSPAFCADEEGSFYSTQIINRGGVLGAAPTYQITAVSLTNIYPGDRILGWSILKFDNTLNAEHVVALYDQTSTTINSASGECYGESEAGSDQMMNTVWLPYATTVQNGVVVRQGPNTVVTIYYAR